ncbi:PREDICTED: zinc transporter 1-like [Nicotiana attenuata]|uniref:Zinc transporter 1 n=1 Tax=Nicotiana attenuata TaxID=49451 RepID=A0A1J6KXX3_NICAT|nr:PREDICTED: zinc transporter 1-like [Nicotiana attenuata]OIT27531.1 zinc transporter 1 [Nicotiana attenuata]
MITQALLVKITTLIHFSILFQSTPIFANCTCEPQDKDHQKTKHEALAYKLVAIASILCASALGVTIPILLNKFKYLQINDYSSLNFLIKAFAAGVILATGFIHILPDAFQSLTNPCLNNSEVFGSFPFAGFVSMMSAIFTLMMESFATGYHRRVELRKAQPLNIEENDGPQILLERTNSSTLIRHRLISQVLELGILVHSVIIGISLGTTENPKTIKPLIIALSFHQFFEGMGLGGCISQAKYRARTIAIMVLFFTLTTPSGIGIGMMISKGYNEQSSSALIVQGVLNSASAGILIYMALVDLLAKDFMHPNLHSNFKLQIIANVSLVLGASSMSLLAKWGGT